MNRHCGILFVAVMLAAGVNAAALDNHEVKFVARGNGNEYGWRGWDVAVGGTLLGYAFPNEESNVYGLRFNLGWQKYANTYGVDLGAFSATYKEFGGIQVNLLANAVEGEGAGLQIGAVNLDRSRFSGVQLGIVNIANNLNGVQIGLLNFNHAGIFFPIINAGF